MEFWENVCFSSLLGLVGGHTGRPSLGLRAIDIFGRISLE
jgi:hypothetical protein